MNNPQQLIDAYIDGMLDDAGFMALSDWLREDDANRRVFTFAVSMHSGIADWVQDKSGGLLIPELSSDDSSGHAVDWVEAVAALSDDHDDIDPVDFTAELARREKQAKENSWRARRQAQSRHVPAEVSHPFVISKTAVVLAIAAMLGLAAWLGWPDATSTDTTDSADRTAQQADPDVSRTAAPAVNVALIRSSVDARWVGLADDQDHRLQNGTSVTLSEGLAEVVFDDGATVIVQAPATFEPTGTNAMRMISGRITATIPDSAQGFKVVTPAGLITDYGTEFGVHVNHDGQTLAQTFTGQIGLLPANGEDEVDLAAGAAIIAAPSGRVREVEPDALAFVRSEEYSARRAATPDAYHRWLAYSYDLRRDPDTVVYYTFDGLDPSVGVLRNQAAGRDASRYDATFDTSGSAPGRFAQKPTLRLARDTDHFAATLERELSAVTLAGWYWVDAMAGNFASLLHTWGKGDTGGIHWHLNTNHGEGWSFEFVQNRRRDPQPSYWHDALSTGWRPTMLTGRWVHLALCYDTDAGQARLYVDGQESARSPVDDGVPVKLGDFRLGNWDAPIDERTSDWPRPLRGRIDEFVVIERSLSGTEVAAMFEAGRPDN